MCFVVNCVHETLNQVIKNAVAFDILHLHPIHQLLILAWQCLGPVEYKVQIDKISSSYYINYSITHKLVTFLPFSLAGWEHVISNLKMTTPQNVIIPLLNPATNKPWGHQACLCSSYNCFFNYRMGILTRQTLSLWGAKVAPPERWLNRLI